MQSDDVTNFVVSILAEWQAVSGEGSRKCSSINSITSGDVARGVRAKKKKISTTTIYNGKMCLVHEMQLYSNLFIWLTPNPFDLIWMSRSASDSIPIKYEIAKAMSL